MNDTTPADQRQNVSRRPGISNQVFPDRFVPRDDLPRVAAAGFAAIEVSLLNGLDHFDDTNAAAVKELATVAGDLGIAIWSIHEQEIPQCLGAASTTEQNIAADEMRRSLELAHQLGASAIPSHVLMNAAFDTDAAEEAEVERRVVERLHELAPEVRASGARIAFENTGRRSWASPSAVARRMVTLPTDAYGFVLDTGHANLMGDQDEIIETFGSRLISLHLNDNYGVDDDHITPQMGSVDWSKVCRHLGEINYQGCFMYEVVGPDPDQVMRDTVAAHRQIFSTILD